MLRHDVPFTPPGSGLASAIGLAVANIDDPSAELSLIAGLVVGEFRLCYQTVAGANEWTLYAWDSASSAGASTPYRINGTSGQWIAVTGKYHDSSHALNGNLTITGGNIAQTGATTLSTGTGDVLLNGVTSAASALNVGLVPSAQKQTANGRLLVSNNNTDAASKSGGLLTGHYTNAEEPFGVFLGSASASENLVLLGGGSASFNAATQIWFYTGANSTTTTGTVRAIINAAGQLSLTATTDATSTTTGSLITAGGVGVAKRSYLGVIGSTFKGNVLAGVQDATAAVAGQVGEVISSSVTAAAVAGSGNVGNVTSISLTAGDWLISGMTVFTGGATGLTVNSTVKTSIVTTSATNGTSGSTMTQESVLALLANGLFEQSIPQVRVNISATTTYYLTEECTYAAGSPTVAGTLIATRMR
jgi:hypothetical protein